MSLDFITTGNESNRLTCLVQNKTEIFKLNTYEGIPETLILNLVSWVFLMLLFTVLRQQAWDYGRLALVNSHGENKRWTQLFYAQGSVGDPNSRSNSIDASNSIPMDRGMFSWIFTTVKLTREQFLLNCGPDAVHYLSFQRHLIVVMAIISFIAITIILPINFQGTLYGDVNSFGHSTMSNLSTDSKLLWAHVFFAIAFVPLVVLIMRRSSGRNAFKTAPTRTIIATNVTHVDCNKETIRSHLRQLFPNITIEDVQLAYNIDKLMQASAEYERILEARIFCEVYKNRDPVLAHPKCYTCESVDALEYYKIQEDKMQGVVERLRASALNEPLGIAFITLQSAHEAQHMILHFRPGSYRDWKMSFAPAPQDINWENLSVDATQWYLKWITINTVLFLVLFFLTTPIIILNGLKSFNSKLFDMSPLISEFLPTLILWTLAALMPVIVSYSETWLTHWTKSIQNYAIMTKSFGYLLFMILILPSLGLTSAQAFVEWTIHLNEKDKFRWDCIFLPDKGAFFVNYIITGAFIGTALELIRFPDLIYYMWKLCMAKSRAETPYIRKSILITFPFGTHYAWMLTVFTISTVYSLVCPLIMPFALVYICLKHFGDRHNIYFAYAPSNMISQGGGRIHSTAVTLTKISVLLLLVIMAGWATLRTGNIESRGIILIMALTITVIMFAFMSPIKRCTTKPLAIVETIDGPSPIYVADVLINRRIISDSPSHLSYGSDNTLSQVLSDVSPSSVPT